MKKGYVTLLIPVYNLSNYIGRLLDSILRQTYQYIDVIVINDGSTDNIIDVLFEYESRFKEKCFGFKIINQENQGVSKTINNGLKLIDGEFLAWPDADDWYSSEFSIEKLVKSLQKTNDNVGIVRCCYDNINEDGTRASVVNNLISSGESENIFEDAFYHKNGFVYAPGVWMIKTKFLDRYIPNREIFTTKYGGQNPQILWPYLFYSECITLNEVLYTYLVRKQSHSRNMFNNYYIKKNQIKDYINTYINVIKSLVGMSDDEKQRRICIINEKLFYDLLELSRIFNNSKDYKIFYTLIKRKYTIKGLRKMYTILFYFSYFPQGMRVVNYLFSKL